MKRKILSISVIVVTALLIVIAISTNSSISTNSVEELGTSLGYLTVVPTLLAVVLAFITNNVLLSLLIGFLSGVLILGGVYCNNIIDFLPKTLLFLFTSVKEIVLDINNIEIIALCFIVGGMIEVARSTGGFKTMAIKLTHRIKSPKIANLLASILGCLIFFDDYANCLILAPIMKPITKRTKVSREKLSFIVDSTAAPVAGIAIVSSWIAVEVSSINNGLQIAGSSSNGFSLFLKSIPFCFYCIFAITFIFINSIIGRDFGPMLEAENKAYNVETISKDSDNTIVKSKDDNKKIFVGIGSILLTVIFAIVSFYICGKQIAIDNGALSKISKFNFSNFIVAISYADTVNLISLAALIGTIFAIVFGVKYKLFTFTDSIKSWKNGMIRILETALTLLLAWCLSDVINQLGTIYFAIEIITSNVSPMIIPILIYICCCLISCASGSFGCMSVLMPLAIPLVYKMSSLGIISNIDEYLLLCIGSVIAGSIFGDHCSPITDCTILAAASSGCSTMEHCLTQLPYALVNCAISIVCGIVLSYLGMPVLLSIMIGIIIQILVLYIIGKKPIERDNNV